MPPRTLVYNATVPSAVSAVNDCEPRGAACAGARATPSSCSLLPQPCRRSRLCCCRALPPALLEGCGRFAASLPTTRCGDGRCSCACSCSSAVGAACAISRGGSRERWWPHSLSSPKARSTPSPRTLSLRDAAHSRTLNLKTLLSSPPALPATCCGPAQAFQLQSQRCGAKKQFRDGGTD